MAGPLQGTLSARRVEWSGLWWEAGAPWWLSVAGPFAPAQSAFWAVTWLLLAEAEGGAGLGFEREPGNKAPGSRPAHAGLRALRAVLGPASCRHHCLGAAELAGASRGHCHWSQGLREHGGHVLGRRGWALPVPLLPCTAVVPLVAVPA